MAAGLEVSDVNSLDLPTLLSLLKALGDSTHDAVWVKDSTGRYLFGNQAAERVLECSKAELVGRTDLDLFPVAIAQKCSDVERRVRESGLTSTSRMNISRSRPDLVFEVTCTPFRNGRGTVAGVLNVAREETRHQFPSDGWPWQEPILERIARRAPLSQTLHDLITVIEEELPGVQGSFLLLEEETQCLHVACGDSLPEEYNRAIEGSAIGPRAGSCGTAAYRGEPVRSDDLQTDPLWEDYRELAARFGFRSCWSVPICSRGREPMRVLGTFAIYSQQSGILDQRVDQIMARIEHIACIAIEQHRHTERIQANESRLKAMVENSFDAVFIQRDGGIIVDVNPRACEMLGYTREELIGADPFLFDVGIQPEFFQVIHEHMSRDERMSFETRHRRKDGLEFPVEVRLSPFRQGDTGFCVTSVHNISSRKQAEEQLHRHLFELKVLNQIGSICASSHTQDEVFTLITQVIATTLFPDNCGFVLFDPSREFLIPHASFVLTEDQTKCVPIPVTSGLIGKTARSGHSHRIADVRLEPDYLLTDTRTRSEMCLPLRVGGQVIGVMNVESSSLNRFSPADEHLMTTVLDLVGSALGRLWQQHRLRDSEIHHRRMLESLPIGVMVHDGNRSYYANPKALQLVGSSTLQEFLQRSPFDLVSPEHRERARARFNEKLQTEEPLSSAEGRLLRNDGTEIDVEVNSLRTQYEGRDCVQVHFHDITARKEAETLLRTSEQRFRMLADAIPQIVWIADLDGGLTHLNAKATEYTGIRVDELTGWNWGRVIHPDDLDHTLRVWQDVLTTGEGQDLEFRIRNVAGEYRWHITRQVPIRNDDGQLVNWYGTCTDIEDLKRVEAELRESEGRLAEAQRIARSGSWGWVPSTGEVWWSAGIHALFGVEVGSVKPSFEEFLALVHPADKNTAITRVQRMLGGENEFADEFRIIRYDGSVIWIHSRGRATRDAEGQIIRVEGIDEDITDRKHAEKLLRDSEERYRSLIAALSEGIVLQDGDSKVLTCNASAERILGLTADQLCSRNFLDQSWKPIHESGTPFLDQEHPSRMCLQTGRPCSNVIMGVHQQDGTLIWLSINCEPLLYPGDAQAYGVVCSFVDVTGRKHAEDALRDSEYRFRNVLDFCPAHIFLKDLQGHYLFVNRGMAEAAGIASNNWVGRTAHDVFPAEVADRFARNDQTMMTALRPLQVEEVAILPDGRHIDLFTILFPLLHDDGTAYALCGISTDITDRKRADAELGRTAGLLQAVVEGTSEAVFVKDCTGKYLLFNEAAARFVGKSVDEVLGRDDTALFDPESARRIMERDQRVRQTGLEETEEETVTASGITRTFLATKGPYFDENGQIAGTIGLSLDISARKEAERALQLTQFTVDRAVDAVFWINPAAEILYVNDAACRTLEYAREELIGRTVPDIDPNFPPEKWPLHWDEIKRRGSFSWESDHVTKSGRKLVTEITVNYLQYEGREYNCAVMRDITARKQTEAERDRLWNQSPDLLCTMSFDGDFRQINPAWSRILGWSDVDLLSQHWLTWIHPDDVEASEKALSDLTRGIPVAGFVNRFRGRDNRYHWLSWSATPVVPAGMFYGFARDVTEEQQLAEQFRQSQKLEAIGRLAGGIAHDFNNLLTVINGYADLLLAGVSEFDSRREPVAEIRKAGARAAELTAQLLAFSRKAVVKPRLVDLNAVVESVSRMLRRLIGEDIALIIRCDPQLPFVNGDHGQFEQVLMNLALNSRDAMPQGGRLIIETSAVFHNIAQSQGQDAAETRSFAQIRVVDTGTGMSEDIQGKIFEPFFTTKDVGKGTGLGLAVVHGVITQFQGQIDVSSAIGLGTAITVLFPAATAAHCQESTLVTRTECRGSETVLLVEDDDGVRLMSRTALENAGFRVFVAGGVTEALEIAKGSDAAIELLVTDVIMPKMNGCQLAEVVRQHHPAVRILYVSGYANDEVFPTRTVTPPDAFLQKPFSPQALVTCARAVLDFAPSSVS